MNARTIALVLKSLSEVEMARFAEILSHRDCSMLERAYSPICTNLQIFDMERFKADVDAIRPGLSWSSHRIEINNETFNVELRAYYKAEVYVDKSSYNAYELVRLGKYSVEPVEGWEKVKISDSMDLTDLLKASDYCTWKEL